MTRSRLPEWMRDGHAGPLSHVLTSPLAPGEGVGSPTGTEIPGAGAWLDLMWRRSSCDSGRGVCAQARQGGWTRRGPRGGGNPSKITLASMCWGGGGQSRRGGPAEQVCRRVGRHSCARATGRPVCSLDRWTCGPRLEPAQEARVRALRVQMAVRSSRRDSQGLRLHPSRGGPLAPSERAGGPPCQLRCSKPACLLP